MDFDAYERRLWAGRATAYERGFARLTAHTAGLLLDAAGVETDTRLLDVGTGPGVVARAAVARGARVTAVDAEPSMAEAAARNVPGLDVRVAVLPDLPLPDGEFDAVTGNFVINAVGDPEATLAELGRVLHAGGRVALTCWDYPPSPVSEHRRGGDRGGRRALAGRHPGPAVPHLQFARARSRPCSTERASSRRRRSG